MTRARRAPSRLSLSSLVSLFSPLSLLPPLLLLASVVRGQTIIARGFHPAGPPDMVAAGAVIETRPVTSQGECAFRALHHNGLGFNLERKPGPDGTRSCQITNTVTGCFSLNMQARVGWDYYFSGRAGQGERITARSKGFTMPVNGDSFPVELSTTDPNYRWKVDCNGPSNTPEKQCSRYVLTGIYNDIATMNDLDHARCFTYGAEFRVSQQDAEIVSISLTSDVSSRNCPRNQVVTALADPDDVNYAHADWMKCNLLMSNWRINYDDCTIIDPRNSGGGYAGWNQPWKTGTPHDHVYGLVGLWRTGILYTGFRSCRLYRMA